MNQTLHLSCGPYMFLDSLGFLETHASRVQTLEGKKKHPHLKNEKEINKNVERKTVQWKGTNKDRS